VYAYERMSFPITCTACHKTFTISDEIYDKKVAGRVVTIKCKSCGHGIRVDGSKGAAGVLPSSPAPAAPAEAAPAAAPPEPVWAVEHPDGQDREFTTPEVLAELERGAVNGQTLLWRDGMAEWLELGQIPEFIPDLARIEAKKSAEAAEKAKREAAQAKADAEAKAKADAEARAKANAEAKAKANAEAKAKANAAAVQLHQPRAPMPTVTGLGSSPSAGTTKPRAPLGSSEVKPRAPLGSSPDLKPRAPLGSSPDLKPRAPLGSSLQTKPRAPLGSSPEITPRAPLGSSPEITPRMPLGASPELVPRLSLGSFSELTPRVPVAAPAMATPKAPPPAPPSAVVDAAPPFPAPPAVTPPVAPAPAFMAAPPFEAPIPPLPASVAKVVSKPPLVPAAVPSFPMSTSPAPTFGALPTVVADHASVEWPESKKKTPLLILGFVAAALAIGGAVFALRGKEELPPPAPVDEGPRPSARPTAASTPTAAPVVTNQPGAETASGSDPIAATPGAGFAELFAAGARKAEAKGASVATASRFDPAATKGPLAQAATEAQACKQSGGPSGKVTVVVTFEPNGKAAGATITDAPFAGTATASCISATMKRASIPPFSGLPGTVSKTFSLL
jgi:GYF domain 2